MNVLVALLRLLRHLPALGAVRVLVHCDTKSAGLAQRLRGELDAAGLDATVWSESAGGGVGLPWRFWRGAGPRT